MSASGIKELHIHDAHWRMCAEGLAEAGEAFIVIGFNPAQHWEFYDKMCLQYGMMGVLNEETGHARFARTA